MVVLKKFGCHQEVGGVLHWVEMTPICFYLL